MIAQIGKAHIAFFKAPVHELGDLRAAILLTQNHEKRLFGLDRLAKSCVAQSGIAAAEVVREGGVAASGEAQDSLRLPLQLDGGGIGDIEPRFIQPHIGAQIPGQQRMLIGRIAADKQDGRCLCCIAKAGGPASVSRQRAGKSCVIGCALVIDAVGLENGAGELLQEIVLLVGGVVRADDADRCAGFAERPAVANLLELVGGKSQRVFPGGRLELAFGVAHKRLGEAVGVLDKIEAEAALGA